MSEEKLESRGVPLAGKRAPATTTSGTPPQPPPPPPPITGPVVASFVAQPRQNRKVTLSRPDNPVASWKEVALVLVAGFFFNIALRTSFATAAALVGFVVLVAVFVSSGRTMRREGLGLCGLALLLTPWLVVRADPTLTAVTVLMILVLLSLAAGLSLRGSLFDSRVRVLGDHLASMTFEWFYGLAMVKRLVKSTSSNKQGAALLRGVAVATPVLLLFGLLLASADEVFARFLLLGNLGDVFGHLLLTAFASFALLGLLGRRAHETAPAVGFANLRRLGPVEVKMVLGSLVALFAAFVATQIVVALGGADVVLETEGLTQAAHARAGFFQLLAVSGLSIALIAVLRAGRLIDSEESHGAVDRFTPLALLTLALTLVIAGVSVQRLLLYIGSFGLTPDRLWALLGAGAIGVAIVLYAVSIAGFRSERSWYPAIALLLGYLVVLCLNVVNPDATIARYNIDQFGDSSELDIRSLANLSDDATTTIVSRLGAVQTEQGQLVALLCGRLDRQSSFGPLEYNVASVNGDQALDDLCGTRPDRLFLDSQ